MPNATTVRTCAACGIEIPTHKHRFCSRACCDATRAAERRIYRAPRTRYTNTCRGCAGTYVTTNRHSQVCSLECRNWINPRVQRSTDIPITHPAHPQYEPPKPRQRVSLRHSERGHWMPVVYEGCVWCNASIVVTPYTAHWTGRLHCSKRCSKKHSRVRRRASEANASGSYTWTMVMALHLRGGRRCSYCDMVMDGQPEPDHVIPLSRGGSNSITNIVTACQPCNGSKGSMTLTEWQASRERRQLPPRRYELAGHRFAHLALPSE